MKKVIIFGITDLAELLFNYLQNQNDIKVCAFTVNKDFLPTDNIFLGLNTVAFEDIEKHFSKEEYSILVCVGYNNMNQSREKIFDAIRQKGYKIESFIHPDAKVFTDKLGEGNIIFSGVIIDILTSVGNGNIFYTGSLLSHHSKIGNYNFFAVKSCIAGHVDIENNCFLGAHSTVKNGVNIQSYSLIGANAYVDRDTEEYNVIVPLKSLRLDGKKSTEFF